MEYPGATLDMKASPADIAKKAQVLLEGEENQARSSSLSSSSQPSLSRKASGTQGEVLEEAAKERRLASLQANMQKLKNLSKVATNKRGKLKTECDPYGRRTCKNPAELKSKSQ